jgi:hypothetical protein
MGRGAYDESVDKNGIVAEFTKDRTAVGICQSDPLNALYLKKNQREEAKANAPKPKVTRARRNNNSVPVSIL